MILKKQNKQILLEALFLINKSKPIKKECYLRSYSSIIKGNVDLIKTDRKNVKIIWLDFKIFERDELAIFINKIYYSGVLTENTQYIVLIKIRKGDIYYTIAEKQCFFSFSNKEDPVFSRLFQFIIARLSKIFLEYKAELEYGCDGIILEFYNIVVDSKLKISNIEDLKGVVNTTEIRKIKKNLFVFSDEVFNVKGIPLNFHYKNEIIQIDDVHTQDDKDLDKFNFDFYMLTKINQPISSWTYYIGENPKLYLVNYRNKKYIVTVDKVLDKKNQVTIANKKCFDMFGSLLSSVKDTQLKNGNLLRESGNSSVIYKRDSTEIIQHSRTIKFESILAGYLPPTSKSDWLSNIKIGSFDIETYKKNGVSYCYAVGYHSSIQNKPSMFYIDKKTLDSNKLIIDCLKQMLTNIKFNNFIFYVHNLGAFDAPFIIKALASYNITEEGKKNPFKFEVNTRDSDILSLKVTYCIYNSKKPIKIVFKDSIAILPFKLRDLCVDFEVEDTKSYFPYDFCNEKTLFYVGKTPDIEWYNEINQKEYKKLYKEIWSLKDECFYYLEKDLLCLYQIMIKANKTLHLLFGIHITDFLTISGISMHIFLQKYYDKKSLPLITHSTIWENIHNAYYGSRVEVYNPIITTSKAYYYDVNSLYPFASLNDLPGNECEYIEYIETRAKALDDLFGFFYCKVKSKDNYLGLLPVRTENNLIFPIGEWEGWYFSEELKFAQENGYKIDIVRGYNFTKKASNIFNDFVSDMSKIKANPKTRTERTLVKLILNSLIGRFGMNFLKPKTEIINKEKLNILTTTRQVKNIIEISNDCFLISYLPRIDKDVCRESGVDFIKILNKEGFNETRNQKKYHWVSISTAAAILAYARIYMSKIKLNILKRRGKLYYTDTDSIVTNIKLLKSLVDSKKLGKFKLEHEIVEGYFISDKLYSFINSKGEIIKVGKSIDSDKLNYDDYINMYDMKILKNAVRRSSVRDYSKGSVNIVIKDDVTLNPTSYTKRVRIFNKKGKWIKTKPVQLLEIRNVNKDSDQDKSDDCDSNSHNNNTKRISKIIENDLSTDNFNNKNINTTNNNLFIENHDNYNLKLKTIQWKHVFIYIVKIILSLLINYKLSLISLCIVSYTLEIWNYILEYSNINLLNNTLLSTFEFGDSNNNNNNNNTSPTEVCDQDIINHKQDNKLDNKNIWIKRSSIIIILGVGSILFYYFLNNPEIIGDIFQTKNISDGELKLNTNIPNILQNIHQNSAITPNTRLNITDQILRNIARQVNNQSNNQTTDYLLDVD